MMVFSSFSRAPDRVAAGPGGVQDWPRRTLLWGVPVVILIPAVVIVGLVAATAFLAVSRFGAAFPTEAKAAALEPAGAAEAQLQQASAAQAPVADAGGTERAQSLLVRGAVGLFLALAYIAVSATMILFNKYLMQEDRFPFAACLTSLHMAGALVLGSLLRLAMPSLFPSFDTIFGAGDGKATDSAEGAEQGWKAALLPFMPIGVASTVALVAGNWAYRYATVTFLQMVKESHIVIVYSLAVLFGLDTLTFRNVTVLLFVACSATLAVYGETRLSVPGLLLQLLAGLAGSTQIVLTNRMMVKSGRGRVDPMTMVLCMAPITLLTLAPANLLFWDHRIPERLVVWWPALVFSVLLAFALQVTMAVAIRSLGGTGLSMSSVAKDLAIVFSAALILHEHITRVQMCGFFGSVAGIAVYSYLKLFGNASNSKR